MYGKGYIIFKYISFWLKASNGKGHGVHSPFVFDFIQNVLLKYNHETQKIDFPIACFGSSTERKYRKMIGRMMTYYGNHQFHFYAIDTNQISFSNYGKKDEHCLPMDIHVYSGIRTSVEAEKQWIEIKKNEKVTCSIDLFFVGILFFKKDFKEKLDFMIRF